MANDKALKQVSDWTGDVMALEAHVEEAMDHQLKIETSDPEVKQVFRLFHDTVRDSKRRAESYVETMDTPPSKGVISKGAELLGSAAGIINKLRHDTASKAIRDDYTAFNHLAISYTMLYTTALAVEDSATASFAEEGLRTYAGLVQKVNEVISKAVLNDLKDNSDFPVDNEMIVSTARDTIDGVWKETAT